MQAYAEARPPHLKHVAVVGLTTSIDLFGHLLIPARWPRGPHPPPSPPLFAVSGIMGQPNVTDSNPPRPDKGVLMRFELLLRVPESRLPRLWHVVVEYRANFTAARPYEVPRKVRAAPV